MTANGGFTANSATSPTSGLCALALTVGTPKLVPASFYPDVPPF